MSTPVTESINQTLQFKRGYNGPLDLDSVFATTSDRIAYLSNNARYAGQIVTDLQTNKAYMLNAAMNAWVELAGGGGSGVESVTATNESISVNNTDPSNPTIGFQYKIYTGYFVQIGVGNPTITEQLNTFEGTPIWSKPSPGVYDITLAGAFANSNKVWVAPIGFWYADGFEIIGLSWEVISADVVRLSFGGSQGSAEYPLGKNISFEIRVYS